MGAKLSLKDSFIQKSLYLILWLKSLFDRIGLTGFCVPTDVLQVTAPTDSLSRLATYWTDLICLYLRAG